MSEIAQAIRSDIKTGRLVGGASVYESQLAERFGVSRTPIREAVARLVAHGLLIKNPGRNGLTVFRPSARELHEIYEIRHAIECLAAGLAAKHRSERDLEDLERHLAALADATDAVSWLESHYRFHMAVYACSDRPRLTSLIEQYRMISEPYIQFYVMIRPLESLLDEHEGILQAVRDGDPVAAEAATSHHLSTTLNKLAEWLEKESDR